MGVECFNIEKIDKNNLPTFSRWWIKNKELYKNKVNRKVAKDIWGASNEAILDVLNEARI